MTDWQEVECPVCGAAPGAFCWRFGRPTCDADTLTKSEPCHARRSFALDLARLQNPYITDERRLEVKIPPDVQKAINFIRDPSGDGSTKVSHGFGGNLKPMPAPKPYTPDRHDLKLMKRIADEGPMFMPRASNEMRALDLRRAGFLVGESAVYSYRAGGSTEIRTRYSLTDAGRELLRTSSAQKRGG